MRRALWRERILWGPDRRIAGVRAAWLAIACGLMLLLTGYLDPLLLRQVPLRNWAPILDSVGMPTAAGWPGNQTRSITSSTGISLTTPVTYAPPRRIGLGFIRPWVTASFNATLVTPSQ